MLRGSRFHRLFRGVRVADLWHTYVQHVSVLSLVDLVVGGDAMVKKFQLRIDELIAYCNSTPRTSASGTPTSNAGFER